MRLKDIFTHYTKKQLFNAFIIDLLFFVLTGGIAIILFINIVFMVIRYFFLLYMVLYAILILFTYMAKKYFIETLTSYKQIKDFDYTQLKYVLVLIYSVVILLIQILIFSILT